VALGAVSTLPLLYAVTIIGAPALLQPTTIGIALARLLATLCFLAAGVAAVIGPRQWPLDWPVAPSVRTSTLTDESLVTTVTFPLSMVLLVTMLTTAGVFVWSQIPGESATIVVVIMGVLHALSWQAYGLTRPRADVGPIARLSIIVVPAAALLWAWTSVTDGSRIALIYAGVAIAATMAAVLSRRQQYVVAAVPAAMRALWRSFLIYR
jgi:hypothetical protein